MIYEKCDDLLDGHDNWSVKTQVSTKKGECKCLRIIIIITITVKEMCILCLEYVLDYSK